MNEINVFKNVSNLENFLQKNSDKTVCLYLADKTELQWNESTSKRYMNEINDKILYLPFNVKKNDENTLKLLYNLFNKYDNIKCINHTHPHKSNKVLKEWLKIKDETFNADVVFKENKTFIPCDCNGPAFMKFYHNEIGSFKQKNVIILGVGGSGSIIAKLIAAEQPKCLYLIDIVDKSKLAASLSQQIETHYFSYLKDLNINTEDIVLINCSGKEGNDSPYLEDFLRKHKSKNNIFIDIRVHMTKPVELARQLGYDAYTGFHMNYLNGYSILTHLCKYQNINPPLLDEFKKLVKKYTKDNL